MERIQKIFLIATGIIALILVASSLLLGIGMISMSLPDRPVVSNSPNSAEQEVKGKEINNYKLLVETEQTRQTKIYDYAIIQTLLPMFTSLITAIITYIFATKTLEIYKAYLVEKNRLKAQQT